MGEARWPLLQRLTLSNFGLKGEDVTGIIKGMHFPNLRHLSLSHNDLGSNYRAFELPATSLPSLVYLDLTHNELTEESIVSLTDALLALNTLKYLDLKNNAELP